MQAPQEPARLVRASLASGCWCCGNPLNLAISAHQVTPHCQLLALQVFIDLQREKWLESMVSWELKPSGHGKNRLEPKWADLIYKWADDSGLIGNVETLFALYAGADTDGQEFFDKILVFVLAISAHQVTPHCQLLALQVFIDLQREKWLESMVSWELKPSGHGKNRLI
uniref:Uncharacterized protein n=1 Tax=Oxyrrhis marina TaxID=2969 RepID=A0A7S3XHF9_OXYMA